MANAKKISVLVTANVSQYNKAMRSIPKTAQAVMKTTTSIMRAMSKSIAKDAATISRAYIKEFDKINKAAAITQRRLSKIAFKLPRANAQPLISELNRIKKAADDVQKVTAKSRKNSLPFDSNTNQIVDLANIGKVGGKKEKLTAPKIDMKPSIDAVKSGLTTISKTFTSTIGRFASTATKSGLKVGSLLARGIGSGVKGVGSLLTKSIGAAIRGVASLTRTVGSTMFSGMKKGAELAVASVSKLQSVYKNFATNAVTALSSVGNSTTKTQSLTKSLLSTVGAVGLAYKAIGAAKSGLSAAFDRVNTIDTATKSLTTLNGSSSQSAKIMKDLQDSIEGTPIALDQVAGGVKKMVAAGMDAGKVKGVFQAVADGAYGVGNGAESIDHMVHAFSQMQSSSQLYLEDLNQLQDQGIPALKILANQSGMTADALKKKISKGAIDSKWAIDALVIGMENGTNGMAGFTAAMKGLAKTSGDTMGGAAANLKTAFVTTFAKGLEPLKDNIVGTLKVATTVMKKFRDTTIGGARAQALLASAGQNVADSINAILTGSASLSDVFAEFSKYTGSVNGLVAALGGLVVAKNVAPMFAVLSKALVGFSPAVGLAFASLGPALLGGAGLAALGVLAINFGDQLDKIINFASTKGVQIVLRLVDSISSKAPTLIQAGTNLVIQIGNGINTALPTILTSVGTLITTLLNGFISASPQLITVLSTALKTVASKLSTFAPLWFSAGLTLINNVLAGINKAAPSLVGSLGSAINQMAASLVAKSPAIIANVIGIINSIASLIANSGPKMIAAGMQLVTNLANGITAGLPHFVQNLQAFLTGAFSAVMQNLPALLGSLSSLKGALIQAIMPALNTMVSQVPNIIQMILNSFGNLANKIPNIVGSVMSSLGNLVDIFNNMLSQILDIVGDVMVNLADSFVQNSPRLINGLVKTLNLLSSKIAEVAPKLLNSGLQLIVKLAEGIASGLPKFINSIGELINGAMQAFSANLPAIMAAGMNILTALINGVIQNAPMLVSTFTQIVSQLAEGLAANLPALIMLGQNLIATLTNSLVENGPILMQAAISIIASLTTFLGENAPALIQFATVAITTIFDGLTNNMDVLLDAAFTLAAGLAAGLIEAAPMLLQSAYNFVTTLCSGIYERLPDTVKAALAMGKNVVLGFAKGVSESVSIALKTMKDFGKGMLGAIAASLGIHSPSKKMAEMGVYTAQGYANGLKSSQSLIEQQASKLAGMVTDQDYDANMTLRGGAYSLAGDVNSSINGLSDEVRDFERTDNQTIVHNEIVGDAIQSTVNNKNADDDLQIDAYF